MTTIVIPLSALAEAEKLSCQIDWGALDRLAPVLSEAWATFDRLAPALAKAEKILASPGMEQAIAEASKFLCNYDDLVRRIEARAVTTEPVVDPNWSAAALLPPRLRAALPPEPRPKRRPGFAPWD
jgi:hypothetical protein